MSVAHSKEHHRVRWLIVLLALLAVLGVRALAQQAAPLTSAEVRRAADTTQQLRVVVSVAARRLWVIGASGDTLRTAPVAVGSGRRLTLGGKAWRFNTPIGVRSVLSTEVDPVWIRPDWAYVELARQRKARLDSVSPGRARALRNGDSLVVRGGTIGIVHGGAFDVLPPEKDVVLGGVLYMPPLGSVYRQVKGALGAYRLNLGSAVGFHGTADTASVGKALTHGCMRLYDADIEWLYRNVPVGTPVFIY